MQEQYQELIEAHNIARHNVDLALSLPRDYTLEEKRRFTEEYDATAKAIDEAICAEFNALPPEFQAPLLRLLLEQDGFDPGFWERLLL